MSYFRRALTAIAFVLLSAVALAAAVQTLSLGLPTSMASNASALIGALSTEDVTLSSHNDQVKLGDRLQRELSEDLDWHAQLSALDQEQRERLVANVAELAKASFDAKVERYFQIPERDQRRYLDAQVDKILNWAVLLDRVSRTEGEALVGPAALAGLMARVGQWYAQATPDELTRMNTFQKALGERLSKRMMRRFQPNQN